MALPPYPLPRETRETAILTGSGVATYGPFAFKIFDIEDVEVWRLDTGATVWTPETVTVAKTSDLAHDTFSITFGAIVPITATFVVLSRRLHERQIAVMRGGALDGVMLEKELSKQGSILQEIRRDLDKTVRFPPGFEGSPPLPKPGPGLLLAWDATGTKLVSSETTTDEAAIRAAAIESLKSLIGGNYALERPDYDSLAAASLANISILRSSVRTNGYAAPGDGGGALYKRAVGEPAHDGKFQSYDGAWWELAETTVNPLMFGGALDGVADDAAAANKATAYIDAIGGGTLDFKHKTSRIDSTIIVGSNITVENAAIDFSNAADNDKLFEAKGSAGSATSFTAASVGSASITVSSAAGISAGDYLYLQSNDAFGVGGNKRGEILRVQDVSGTTVTFWRRLRDTYTTTPTFYKPAFLENVKYKNLILIGKNTTSARQYAFDSEYVDTLRFTNVISRNFGDRHYQITNVLGFNLVSCSMRGISHGVIVGLSYGIAVNEASEAGLVLGCYFTDLKHGIAIAGETGVARNIKVTKCVADAIFDGAYDCHPQSDGITFDDNDCDNASPIGSSNGIVAQGANVTITNNRISGFVGTGILAQPACISPAIAQDDYKINGNTIRDGYGSVTYSIYIQNLRTSGELTLAVNDNTCFGLNGTLSHGIWIEVPANKGLVRGAGVSVNENQVLVKGNGIVFQTGAAGGNCSIQQFSANDNKVRTTGASYYPISFSSGQAGYITSGCANDNQCYGGAYSLLNTDGTHIGAAGNQLRAYATGATSGTFVNTTGGNYTS